MQWWGTALALAAVLAAGCTRYADSQDTRDIATDPDGQGAESSRPVSNRRPRPAPALSPTPTGAVATRTAATDAGAAEADAGPGDPLPDASPPPSVAERPIPDPGDAPSGSVRFVLFVADTEVAGRPVAAIAEFSVFGPDDEVIDRSLWQVTADGADAIYQGGMPPQQAIDGDPDSLWHTPWFELADPPPYPHYLALDLGAYRQVAGFRYLPRQDQDNGRIAAYRLFTSQDGSDFGDPVASGVFPDGRREQIIRLSRD
jgi:hypothetical protein